MAAITFLPAALNRQTRMKQRRGPAANLFALLQPRLPGPAPCSVPVAGLGACLCVKIASTREEWEEAYRLVADNYQARGYQEDGWDYRFTSYHVLPDSVTFVAKQGERLVGTFSLVPDNSLLGLPLEETYGPEIRQLRQQGRRLAEVTSLAVRELSLRAFVRVFEALIRLMMQYHVRHGGDALVFTVNPRHSVYYRTALGSVPFGSRRAYAAVRNHPAEAFLLDASLMKANAPDMYRKIFGQRLPIEALTAAQLPTDLIRYYGSRSSLTNLRFIEEILAYVADCGSPRRW